MQSENETTKKFVLPILSTCDKVGLTHFGPVIGQKVCDRLIEICNENESVATVSGLKLNESYIDKARIACTASPSPEKYPLIAQINQMIAKITGIPIENQEPTQLIHYKSGGGYLPHFDCFDAGYEALDLGGNRTTTVLLYLNTVPVSGETGFPELGLKIKPVMGYGVIFKSLDKNGKCNPLSLHSSEVLESGEKWVVSKWIRERPFKNC